MYYPTLDVCPHERVDRIAEVVTSTLSQAEHHSNDSLVEFGVQCTYSKWFALGLLVGQLQPVAWRVCGSGVQRLELLSGQYPGRNAFAYWSVFL